MWGPRVCKETPEAGTTKDRQPLSSTRFCGRRPKIGLVVPALAGGGGVLTVASFLKESILASGKYDLKVLSLATSMSDNCSVSLLQPLSWLAGVRSSSGIWQGIPYIHVGSFLGELEFQRFKPRRCLAEHLADCDVVQVVCGSPA